MKNRQINAEGVRLLYQSLSGKLHEAKKRFGRPMTLAEKILAAHLDRWNEGEVHPVRGQSYVYLRPDRVAMQDATAQMAILQFMQANLDKVFVPSTVHCDHLIQARKGAAADLTIALESNSEVYDFLKSASAKYGIGFWEPGSGIIHQVVLENYAFPGSLLIGTDSHTPNAGGLGMVAIGVGGADATFTMAGEPWGVRWPKLIGVKLTGSLSGWASPKDVILKLAGILTVAGGTGAIVEYFGPGTRSISATGKATITNMGAELGATTSLFPLDEHMLAYLRLTGRADVADLASLHGIHLMADPEVEQEPEKFFDRVIEIDLDTLEPHVVGPHTPDLARPLSELKAEVAEKGWPANLRYALIGSCTNSSYEDMSRAAAVAKQAAQAGLSAKIGFLVTPGSEQVHKTITRDGQIADLEAIGGNVLANACGPCIGQWKRDDIAEGEKNSIITSFNRNFPRRNDGNAETLAFIASPEIVVAFALAGDLDFNPLTDTLPGPDGTQVKLAPPPQVGLPEGGFEAVETGFVDGGEGNKELSVAFRQGSERLQPLNPFSALACEEFLDLPIMLKAEGKCTTDHISPAGPWLKFRGHLDRISDNMFVGANNAFTDAPGTAYNVLTGKQDKVGNVARHYKAAACAWAVIGDDNYGEGSSREHAAMSPRYLGCKVVIAKSFARIHETNLKQQGILALTFENPQDWAQIEMKDHITVRGLRRLEPGKPVEVIVARGAGILKLQAKHTMTAEQIGWFQAGSALNYVRNRRLAEARGGKSTDYKSCPVDAAGRPIPGAKVPTGPEPIDSSSWTGIDWQGPEISNRHVKVTPPQGNGSSGTGSSGNSSNTGNGTSGNGSQRVSLWTRFWRWVGGFFSGSRS